MICAAAPSSRIRKSGRYVRIGSVEIDLALVDQLHHERARPELRDGPDLEDGVGGGFHAGGPAQHAGGVVDDLTVCEDGHGRGRDVVLLDQPGQLVGDPGLHLVQGAHGATPYERLV